jgi:hypothetical protein
VKLRIREVTVGPVAIVAAVIAVGALAGGLSVALGGPATTGVEGHVGGGPGTSLTTPPSTGARTGRRKTTTSLAPTAPASTVPPGASGVQGTQYTKTASAEASAYASDAWCGPLQDASGKTLAALETDVASGVNQLSSMSSPAMVNALSPSLGQVAPSPLERPTATVDLATATAIVPVNADPVAVTLRTDYCFAAVQPLTGYQVTARGGSAVVDFEAAYTLDNGGHVSWRHLWWQTAIGFGPCGQNVCLSDWKAPGASVLYWVAQAPSTAPKYVVPGLDGAWQLSYPPS